MRAPTGDRVPCFLPSLKSSPTSLASSSTATEARDRALAALKVKPGATLTEIAKVAKVSRSTAANAARERETPKPAPTERQQRAQRFLKDALAHGPERATDVEEAASKAHVDPRALDQARASKAKTIVKKGEGDRRDQAR